MEKEDQGRHRMEMKMEMDLDLDTLKCVGTPCRILRVS